MNKARLTLNTFAVVIVTLTISSITQAQATRTWVSGTGDDTNPCSRIEPCRTFAAALAVTAPGGEISVIDAGSYGPVTIAKSVTINGTGTLAGIVAGPIDAVTVNAGTNDVVVLRSLEIIGAGTGPNGIKFLAGKALHVEKVKILGFTNNGIDVNHVTLFPLLTVQDTTIRSVGSSGISVVATSDIGVVITNTQIDRSGVCIMAGLNSRVTVRNSTLSLSSTGIDTFSGAGVNVLDTLISNNVTGINVVSGANVSIGNNTFANNLTGVANSGTVQSTQDSRFFNNPTPSSGNPFVTSVKQ